MSPPQSRLQGPAPTALPARHHNGHDLHFLSRLSRLEDAERELALRLYRDRDLVEAIFTDERVPSSAEKVAVALDAAGDSPLVLVNRSGAFITALARGMGCSNVPRISRSRLDAHVRRMERVLQLRATCAAELRGIGGVDVVIGRILSAGVELSREEFVAFAALEPLLGRAYLAQALHSFAWLCEVGPRVAAMRGRPIPWERTVDGRLLREFWNRFHAVGHFLLLATSGGRESVAALDLTLRSGGFADLHALLLDGMLAWGQLPLVARALWALSRAGREALAWVKPGLAAATTIEAFRAGVLGACAAGGAQRKLWKEVEAAIRCSPMAPGGGLGRRFAAELVADVQGSGKYTLDGVPPAWREFYARELDGVEGGAALVDSDGQIPGELAFALVANSRGDLHRCDEVFALALSSARPVARASGEHFYLPAATAIQLRESYTPGAAVALASPWDEWGRPESAHAPQVLEMAHRRALQVHLERGVPGLGAALARAS